MQMGDGAGKREKGIGLVYDISSYRCILDQKTCNPIDKQNQTICPSKPINNQTRTPTTSTLTSYAPDKKRQGACDLVSERHKSTFVIRLYLA